MYCLLYAVAGAVIGMAAKVLLPALESRDDAFAEFVEMQSPPVLAGLVLAAALAAVMSTSSGALIATATVFSQDIVARLRHRDIEAGSEHDHIRNNRLYVAGFGAARMAGHLGAMAVGTVATLVAKPTDPDVLAEWDRRSRGEDAETVPNAGLPGFCQRAECRLLASIDTANVQLRLSMVSSDRQFTDIVNFDVCQIVRVRTI